MTADKARVVAGLCSVVVLLAVVCFWRYRKANSRAPAVREDDISSGEQIKTPGGVGSEKINILPNPSPTVNQLKHT
jgi:hypothetical protein